MFENKGKHSDCAKRGKDATAVHVRATRNPLYQWVVKYQPEVFLVCWLCVTCNKFYDNFNQICSASHFSNLQLYSHPRTVPPPAPSLGGGYVGMFAVPSLMEEAETTCKFRGRKNIRDCCRLAAK